MMVRVFKLVRRSREASRILVALSLIVIVTSMVIFNPYSPHDEVRKDHVSEHVSSPSTVCVDGHDTWTNNMKATESMSAEEMYRYLRWTNSTSCHNAVDFGFNIGGHQGVAAVDGHKAVCLDKHISPDMNNCLAYSFGIANEWAFDEAMAKYGCQVYSFDPSMNVSAHDRSEHIHFYDIGLDGENRLHPTKGWRMKTASSIYEMLAGRHGDSALIDVFKIDIETSEWDAIPQMLNSGFLANRVKQLVAEIHLEADDALEVLRHRVQILRNLEATGQDQAGGFVRFSSRPNPFFDVPLDVSRYKKGPIPMDLAWYNSRYYPSVV